MMQSIRPLLIALSLLAAPASAHIVFSQGEAPTGSYYAGFLRVSHGCGASATREVRVEIPESIASARPQPKPGWTVRIERAPLARPVPTEGGGTLTERVAAIVWTGGTLPADQWDQFGIMMKLPGTAGALYFPTRQRCEAGENAWVNIPASPDAWHATPSPAPMLVLTAPPPMPMDHHH